jgi:hypothetical protein
VEPSQVKPGAPKEPPAPVVDKPPLYADESLKDGIVGMKETAKWLIVSFAVVVNSFILTGIGLGNLGEVSGLKLVGAIAALAVAFAAVAVAIVAAAKVLASGQVTLTDLKGESPPRADIKAALAPELFGGFDTVGAFADYMTESAKKQVETLKSLYSKPWGSPEDPELKRVTAEYNLAIQRVRTLRPTLERLLLVASYTDVRLRLEKSRRILVWCFIAVGVAAIGFTLAVHKDKSKTVLDAPRLSFVRLDFTPSGQRQFGSRLGAGCDFDNVSALVLGGQNERLQVLTLPRSNCSVVQLSLGAGKADVEPVGLPSIEVP